MKSKLSISTVLIVAAIAVGSPRWMGAALEVDAAHIPSWLPTILNLLNVFASIGMAVLETLSVPYMFSYIRTVKSKTKTSTGEKWNIRWLGVVFFAVGILILTPAILVPHMLASMNGSTLVDFMTSTALQGIWVTLLTVAPLFIVGGVGFAENGFNKQQKINTVSNTDMTVNVSDMSVTKKNFSELSKKEREEFIDMTTELAEKLSKKYKVSIRTIWRWSKTIKETT